MEIMYHNETATDPGLVFITPYQQPQAGPYIFDKKGVSLVKRLLVEDSILKRHRIWFGPVGPTSALSMHTTSTFAIT